MVVQEVVSDGANSKTYMEPNILGAKLGKINTYTYEPKQCIQFIVLERIALVLSLAKQI